MTQKQIDDMLNASREADEGPTQFVRRVETAAMDAERKRLSGGNDLDAMCEAFHRLIEAYVVGKHPFHQPVAADAQIALRVLRGMVAELRA